MPAIPSIDSPKSYLRSLFERPTRCTPMNMSATFLRSSRVWITLILLCLSIKLLDYNLSLPAVSTENWFESSFLKPLTNYSSLTTIDISLIAWLTALASVDNAHNKCAIFKTSCSFIRRKLSFESKEMLSMMIKPLYSKCESFMNLRLLVSYFWLPPLSPDCSNLLNS